MQGYWETRLEKLGWRVLMLFMTALLIAQVMIGYQRYRVHQTNAQISKQDTRTSFQKAGKITFRLVEGQHLTSPAIVRVNGELMGQFSGQSYSVLVVDGDVVTIDTSSSDSIYDFIVDLNDPSFTSPLAGEVYESSALHRALIGPVLLSKN